MFPFASCASLNVVFGTDYLIVFACRGESDFPVELFNFPFPHSFVSTKYLYLYMY